MVHLARLLVAGVVITTLQFIGPTAETAAETCADRGSQKYVPRKGTTFNDPTGSSAEEHRIISQINKNIGSTPSGRVIRIASLDIGIKSTIAALIEAARCGVQVRVLVPGRAWKDPGVVTLRRALGTDVSKPTYITSCDGSCTSAGSKGIMHVKLYLFSKVNGVHRVTVYSSSNLAVDQVTDRYNDAYQVVENRHVYAPARRFFDKLRRNVEVSFPTLTKSAHHWQYFFPSRRHFHVRALGHTRCRTPSGHSAVHLVASIWKDAKVAAKLADLRAAGCHVHVVAAVDRVERPVLRTLLRSRVPTRVQSSKAGDEAVHSKYVAIRGRHRGALVHTVYTGSLNVSAFSTHTANNVMIRIVNDRSSYQAYRRNFERLWHDSRPLRRSDLDSAATIDAGRAERHD